MTIEINSNKIDNLILEKDYYSSSAILINEGLCEIEINGKREILEKNNIFLRLPNTVVELIDTENLNISIFTIKTTTWDNAIYNLPSHFLQSLSENPIINLTNFTRKIKYLFRGLEVTNEEDHLFKNEIILNLLRNFYMELANIVLSSGKPVNMGLLRHSRRLCDSFIKLVRENPQHHSVAFFADKLCITPKYLSKISQQHIGVSAKNFINRQLIGEVKIRLSSMDLTLEELAIQLNFSSVSSLCRFFKNSTGESMKRFRKI